MNGNILNFQDINKDYNQVYFKSGWTDLFTIKLDQKIAVLATNEYEGIFKNGGIGTYYKTLSENLAAQGWYVILVLAFAKYLSSRKFIGGSDIPAIKHIFATDEIDSYLQLNPIQQGILKTAQATNEIIYHNFAYTCFLQALSRQFPQNLIYVEFQEMTGLGFCTNQAKQCDILPNNVVTAVTMHSGHEWIAEANEKYVLDEEVFYFWQKIYWERMAFAHADLGFFPSYFLKSKVDSYGWDTSKAENLPYFIPIINLDESIPGEIFQLEPGKIPVIFFGRLEERKGLCVLIDALKLLQSEIKQRIEVIFVGKVVPLQSSRLKSLNSQEHIEKELENSRIKYQLFTNFFSQQALQFISKLNQPVVCLTSHQENFPNTSLEIGQLPVTLVVSQTGGFIETLKLIQRSEGINWFTPRDAVSLKNALTTAINNHQQTPTVPHPSDLQQTNQTLLQQRLAQINQVVANPSPPTNSLPKITIAIAPGFTSTNLLDCLASISQQTYENFDVVVIEGQSSDNKQKAIYQQAKSQFSQYKFINQVNAGDLQTLVGGDYCLGLNSDQLLLPFALKSLVQAALNSQAGVIACPSWTDCTSPINFHTIWGGELPTWLTNQRKDDICILFKTSLLNQIPPINLQFNCYANTHILLASMVTGEKVIFYPYPLYDNKGNDGGRDSNFYDQQRYYLRQYLGQIPPSQWTQRQQYMLLAAGEQLSQENARSQQTIQELNSNLVDTQSQLQQAQARIAAMESSKFWQLRGRWFRIKRKLGLPTNE